jgi:hypothetical protein
LLPGDARALSRGRWSYLAVTYDGATVRIYVNGVLTGTRARTAAIASRRGPLRVGGGVRGQSFRGRLDDVRIYGRVLGSEQIRRDADASV